MACLKCKFSPRILWIKLLVKATKSHKTFGGKWRYLWRGSLWSPECFKDWDRRELKNGKEVKKNKLFCVKIKLLLCFIPELLCKYGRGVNSNVLFAFSVSLSIPHTPQTRVSAYTLVLRTLPTRVTSSPLRSTVILGKIKSNYFVLQPLCGVSTFCLVSRRMDTRRYEQTLPRFSLWRCSKSLMTNRVVSGGLTGSVQLPGTEDYGYTNSF